MKNDILTGKEVFSSREHVQHYKQQIELENIFIGDYYYRDIRLSIGKYTVKQAILMIEKRIDIFINCNGKIPKVIKCSVEFYDSLRTKYEWSLRPVLISAIPLKIVYKQKEDLILE